MKTKLTEETIKKTTKRTIELDGNIIHTKKGYSAFLSKNNYGLYVCDALHEIASSTALNKLDIKLILLLMSQLPQKNYGLGGNRIRLMRGDDYSKLLKSNIGNICRSFQTLEQNGYIKRFRETKSIELTINPALATAEKVANIDAVYNDLSFDFCNPKIGIENQQMLEEQNWDSDLERDLNGVDGIDHTM